VGSAGWAGGKGFGRREKAACTLENEVQAAFWVRFALNLHEKGELCQLV